MKKYVLKIKATVMMTFWSLLLFFISTSCVEEFNATTSSFESILVIDAAISDEHKQHEVNLSRTYRFEEAEGTKEQNAEITIMDSQNNFFEFTEVSPGRYISMSEFAAQPNIEYTLSIKTNDQNIYTSSPAIMIQGDEIDELDVKATVNDDGEEGVEIRAVTLSNPDTKYYRYNYEETNQIIAPRWSKYRAVVISQFPPKVELVLKTTEDRVCYNTNIKNNGILSTALELNDNTTQRTPIRFIPKFDNIIANRYSILVKQHSVSRAAHKFYTLLKEFSASGSLFSQIQTGFIDGNIRSENKSQKAIGFFTVSSVASKRVFFNFRDYFPNQNPTNPGANCPITTPELEQLVLGLLNGSLMYYFFNECLIMPAPEECDFTLPQGPFEVVPPECGDCTLSGTNIRPDFWVD